MRAVSRPGGLRGAEEKSRGPWNTGGAERRGYAAKASLLFLTDYALQRSCHFMAAPALRRAPPEGGSRAEPCRFRRIGNSQKNLKIASNSKVVHRSTGIKRFCRSVSFLLACLYEYFGRKFLTLGGGRPSDIRREILGKFFGQKKGETLAFSRKLCYNISVQFIL